MIIAYEIIYARGACVMEHAAAFMLDVDYARLTS